MQQTVETQDRATSGRDSGVAGVADMRAYAKGTPPTADWLAGRAAPVFADAISTVSAIAPRGEGRVDGLAADEFVILLAGRLEIDGGANRLVLDVNESGVLPYGTSFGWRASEDALAIVVSVPAGAHGDAEGPVKIDETAALTPSNPPLPELLVGPTPQCRNHSDYWSATREFVCGTWDSTPYHRKQLPFRHIELMHLLEGSVTFTDRDGSATYSTGDVILAMRGEGCAWISEEHVKKVYATHRPAA